MEVRVAGAPAIYQRSNYIPRIVMGGGFRKSNVYDMPVICASIFRRGYY